tara:strand:+ start:763 stop:1365 length:603 start_codon:yes stop_codon:yes gene_type:complete
MSDSYRGFWDRYVLFIGAIFIALIYYFAIWILAYVQLQTVEKKVGSEFKWFKVYNYDAYLPAIDVLDPTGQNVNITDSGGQYTILNIWATWCAPCVKELPSLKQLDTTLKRGKKWRVIAVSIDFQENLGKLSAFTKKYDVEDIANYYDYKRGIQKNVNVGSLPVTLILNPSGKILYEIHGDALWHSKEIIDFLRLVEKVH